ncbi:MAG: type II secretion system minor pseudopilin GspI [Pseudomonadota bacterium]
MLRRDRGFTLVEVMVALIIVSLAGAAVVKQLVQSARNTRQVQMRTVGMWIAQNKVAELRIVNGLPSTGRDDGDIEYAGQDWVWESTVEPPNDQVQNFLRIDVTVALASNPDQIVADAVGFVGQGGDGALGRPFDTRLPVGPGATPGNAPGQPANPAPGRGPLLTPQGNGT